MSLSSVTRFWPTLPAAFKTPTFSLYISYNPKGAAHYTAYLLLRFLKTGSIGFPEWNGRCLPKHNSSVFFYRPHFASPD